MRRFVVMLAFAMLVVAAAPGTAGAWQVRNNAGTVVGTVGTGVNDYGQSVGLIRAASSDTVLANVLRVVQDEFDGWLLINGTADVDWVGGILRRSSTQFILGRVDGSHPVVRATKTSDGNRWVLRRKRNGVWLRIGAADGRCKGSWAVGAARKLLWVN